MNTQNKDIPRICLNRYNILQDGKHVECNLLGWVTALAHARKYTSNIFHETKKVEIVNIWTSEIVTLEEAEKRAAAYYAKRSKTAVNSGTTF